MLRILLYIKDPICYVKYFCYKPLNRSNHNFLKKWVKNIYLQMWSEISSMIGLFGIWMGTVTLSWKIGWPIICLWCSFSPLTYPCQNLPNNFSAYLSICAIHSAVAWHSAKLGSFTTSLIYRRDLETDLLRVCAAFFTSIFTFSYSICCLVNLLASRSPFSAWILCRSAMYLHSIICIDIKNKTKQKQNIVNYYKKRNEKSRVNCTTENYGEWARPPLSG